jgi:hypothetical protein
MIIISASFCLSCHLQRNPLGERKENFGPSTHLDRVPIEVQTAHLLWPVHFPKVQVEFQVIPVQVDATDVFFPMNLEISPHFYRFLIIEIILGECSGYPDGA